jgi:CpXC protein
MSVFNDATVTCTACGAEAEFSLAASVNADRRPDLRDAIIDGSFQAMECPTCKEPLRLPAHMTYLDVARGQWTLVSESEAATAWQDTEKEAREAFDLNFGADAPAEAREIGDDLHPRIVFGWPALREKLICSDLGLDDATLELLKVAIVANVPGSLAADQTELRLQSGDETSLDFSWINSETEEALNSLEVPRVAYDEVIEDAADWQPMRERLTAGMYVDMKRLLTPPTQPHSPDSQ